MLYIHLPLLWRVLWCDDMLRRFALQYVLTHSGLFKTFVVKRNYELFIKTQKIFTVFGIYHVHWN